MCSILLTSFHFFLIYSAHILSHFIHLLCFFVVPLFSSFLFLHCSSWSWYFTSFTPSVFQLIGWCVDLKRFPGIISVPQERSDVHKAGSFSIHGTVIAELKLLGCSDNAPFCLFRGCEFASQAQITSFSMAHQNCSLFSALLKLGSAARLLERIYRKAHSCGSF